MKLSLEAKQSIQNNKVTFVKNCIDINNTLDFNKLISFIERSDTDVLIKEKEGKMENMLKSNMQIKNVQNNFLYIKNMYENLGNTFNYILHPRDAADIFFSFKSNPGVTHFDAEDVFIFGFYGMTLYKIIDDSNAMNIIDKGDMLYIPKGIPHKVISLSERIVVSFGMFGDKKTAID